MVSTAPSGVNGHTICLDETYRRQLEDLVQSYAGINKVTEASARPLVERVVLKRGIDSLAQELAARRHGEEPVVAHALRSPCRKCGSTEGTLRSVSKQDVVRCAKCDSFQYNAPRTETGKKKRTVDAVHENLSAKRRMHVMVRANLVCEVCHRPAELHVGHLLSVADGLELGLTEEELNADENLCVMCDACNLGLGRETVPLRLAASIFQARLRGAKGAK